MIGFSGTWLVNDDWLIRGTAEAFTIDQGNTEGDFYNLGCLHSQSLARNEMAIAPNTKKMAATLFQNI